MNLLNLILIYFIMLHIWSSWGWIWKVLHDTFFCQYWQISFKNENLNMAHERELIKRYVEILANYTNVWYVVCQPLLVFLPLIWGKVLLKVLHICKHTQKLLIHNNLEVMWVKMIANLRLHSILSNWGSVSLIVNFQCPP